MPCTPTLRVRASKKATLDQRVGTDCLQVGEQQVRAAMDGPQRACCVPGAVLATGRLTVVPPPGWQSGGRGRVFVEM